MDFRALDVVILEYLMSNNSHILCNIYKYHVCVCVFCVSGYRSFYIYKNVRVRVCVKNCVRVGLHIAYMMIRFL